MSASDKRPNPPGAEAEGKGRKRPEATGKASPEAPGHAPRRVQPGFEDTAPGITPEPKESLEPGELHEDAGGRFAKQLSEAPEKARPRTPKPRSSS